MTVFTTFRFGIQALLLASCTKAEESSQEIPSENFLIEMVFSEFWAATV
jgi:hypothetical protein